MQIQQPHSQSQGTYIHIKARTSVTDKYPIFLDKFITSCSMGIAGVNQIVWDTEQILDVSSVFDLIILDCPSNWGKGVIYIVMLLPDSKDAEAYSDEQIRDLLKNTKETLELPEFW